MRQEHAAIVLSLTILLPFVGSIAAAFLHANARNAASWIAGSVATACVLLVASLYPFVADGGSASVMAQWLPQRGLDFQLRMDGYACFFARMHGPSLGNALGAGCILICSMLTSSALLDRAVLHELVIAACIFINSPVTAMMLMRAAAYRTVARERSGQTVGSE